MKNVIMLPDEYDFVREELESAYEQALIDIESGTRPEFSAGQLKMVRTIIDGLEGRWTEKRRQLREVANG